MDEPGFGRTRWRRFGLLMLLSIGLTAGMVGLVANGALAVGFNVSGQNFKVSADKLVATGFVQYGSVDAGIDPGSNPPKQVPQPVAVSAMKTAEITNLCQSVVTDLGVFGKVTLVITAGIDLYLLQIMATLARRSASIADDVIFVSEISFGLYVLPLLFGGLGVNLVSHVLVSHLEGAERRFDRERERRESLAREPEST